ncbi:MAG: COX15/CtaA family protein [Hyphomicrobiaceae bacterium]
MTPGVAAATRTDNQPLGRGAEEGDAAVSRWLMAVALLVVAMVAVGGATRLTDSGLSITQWKPLLGAIPPLSAADWADAFARYKAIPEYKLVNAGMSLEAFKYIYWWEWGHRFLGRFIGLVYALPLVGFWMAGRIPSRLKVPLVAVLLLGALQGFVGWYMVQSGLTERVDVSHYRLAMHLGLAFVILGCLVWLGLAVRPVDPLVRLLDVGAPVRWMAVALVLLILCQVLLGAFVAGTKAGLTYNTWPLMDGDLIPSGMWNLAPWYMNIAENLTTIQFNHRLMAYALVALAAVQALVIARHTDNRQAVLSARLLGWAIVMQAGLGIWTLLAVDGAIPIGLGVAHQTAAAVVFAISIWHMHTVHGASARS